MLQVLEEARRRRPRREWRCVSTTGIVSRRTSCGPWMRLPAGCTTRHGLAGREHVPQNVELETNRHPSTSRSTRIRWQGQDQFDRVQPQVPVCTFACARSEGEAVDSGRHLPKRVTGEVRHVLPWQINRLTRLRRAGKARRSWSGRYVSSGRTGWGRPTWRQAAAMLAPGGGDVGGAGIHPARPGG
jgi:hypothetical protein